MTARTCFETAGGNSFNGTANTSEQQPFLSFPCVPDAHKVSSLCVSNSLLWARCTAWQMQDLSRGTCVLPVLQAIKLNLLQNLSREGGAWGILDVASTHALAVSILLDCWCVHQVQKRDIF
jgi:hypothetical protein